MKRRFQPREALLVYAMAFGGALAFFLLGVYAGRSFFPAAPPPAAENTVASGESVRPDLNFYNDMVPPDKENREEDPTRPTESPEEAAGRAQPSAAAAKREGKRSGEESSVDAPSPSVPARKSPSRPPRRFVTIQVGALNTMEEARQVLIRLEAKGYAGRLVEPVDQGDFYRVWVGEFDTELDASSLEARLKSDDFPTYLKTVEEPRSD